MLSEAGVARRPRRMEDWNIPDEAEAELGIVRGLFANRLIGALDYSKVLTRSGTDVIDSAVLAQRHPANNSIVFGNLQYLLSSKRVEQAVHRSSTV